MNNIIIFDSKVADRIFAKLSNFYSHDSVMAWKNKLNKDINELFEKYKIIQYALNDKSYMGIVLECESSTYGEIIIKIVPPMINRYKTEVETLKKLPKELTCKIHETDFNKSAIVMERILPGNLVEYDSNEETMFKLFNVLYNNKIEIDETINKKFKDFKEIVEHDYLICKQKENSNIVDILYESFKIKYNELCSDKNNYLLHGDIYKNNILLSNSGLKIIDPLGFKAPFVMELVSICAYEIFNNFENNNYNLIVNKYIEFFKDYVDEITYRKALFCQLVKVFIPSIFEANDNGVRAKKWLDIIKKLYPEEL